MDQEIRCKEQDAVEQELDSFDEIALTGPMYRFALLVFQKPRLVKDMPRGTKPDAFHPRRLLVEVPDQYSEAVRKRVKAQLSPYVDELGWIDNPV